MATNRERNSSNETSDMDVLNEVFTIVRWIKENIGLKETVCRWQEIKCIDMQKNWMTQKSKTDDSDQVHASYKDSVT